MCKRPGITDREALNEYPLSLVRSTNNSSNIKQCLSMLRFLEKLHWIGPTVQASCWMVSAVDKFTANVGQQGKVWGTTDALRGLCNVANSFEDWEFTALAAISISLGLRARKQFQHTTTRVSSHGEGPKVGRACA